MSNLCVMENLRQFIDRDRDNWAEIQADESAAGKRKYHRGRRVRQDGIVWMAGAAKIHKGRVEKLIARVVQNRRAENLLPMLVDLVRHDGVLTTDCWRAYGGFAAEATKKAEADLSKLAAAERRKEAKEASAAESQSRPGSPQAASPARAAPAAHAAPAALAAPAGNPGGSRPGSPQHHTVNHSAHFKDPVTGAHSNHIEGMWAVLKNELRRRFGRVGFSDLEMMNDRLQLAVWLCNTRLAYLRDKENGLNTVRAFFCVVFKEPIQPVFPTPRPENPEDPLEDIPAYAGRGLAFDDDGMDRFDDDPSDEGTDRDAAGDD
jgi:hypothetical protein